MWAWFWSGQFTRGEELILLIAALIVEDWIDQFRARRTRS